jgi:hypothetical protein
MYTVHKRRADDAFTNFKSLTVATPKRRRIPDMPKCTFDNCPGTCPVLLEIQCSQRHLVCAGCLQDKFEANAHFVQLGGGQTLTTRVVCHQCHIASSSAATDSQCQVFATLQGVRGLHPQVCTRLWGVIGSA